MTTHLSALGENPALLDTLAPPAVQKAIIDGVVLAPAVTHPWWIDWLSQGDPLAHSLVLWVGVLLITMRALVYARAALRWWGEQR